jgi:hypothetical protein
MALCHSYGSVCLEECYPMVWARRATDTRIYTSGWTSKYLYWLVHNPSKRLSPVHVTSARCISRDLRWLLPFITGAAQRIAIAAYAQGTTSSLFFCCGESPRRCRVCVSVCARHGKRLPLRRQFELHVRCPIILSSEMLNVAGALQSKHSVIYAMI